MQQKKLGSKLLQDQNGRKCLLDKNSNHWRCITPTSFVTKEGSAQILTNSRNSSRKMVNQPKKEIEKPHSTQNSSRNILSLAMEKFGTQNPQKLDLLKEFVEKNDTFIEALKDYKKKIDPYFRNRARPQTVQESYTHEQQQVRQNKLQSEIEQAKTTPIKVPQLNQSLIKKVTLQEPPQRPKSSVLRVRPDSDYLDHPTLQSPAEKKERLRLDLGQLAKQKVQVRPHKIIRVPSMYQRNTVLLRNHKSYSSCYDVSVNMNKSTQDLPDENYIEIRKRQQASIQPLDFNKQVIKETILRRSSVHERGDGNAKTKAYITNKLLKSFRQSKNSSRHRTKELGGEFKIEMNLVGQKAKTNFLNVKIKTPGLLSSVSKQSIEHERAPAPKRKLQTGKQRPEEPLLVNKRMGQVSNPHLGTRTASANR